jgi:hypothetical protein
MTNSGQLMSGRDSTAGPEYHARCEAAQNLQNNNIGTSTSERIGWRGPSRPTYARVSHIRGEMYLASTAEEERLRAASCASAGFTNAEPGRQPDGTVVRKIAPRKGQGHGGKCGG